MLANERKRVRLEAVAQLLDRTGAQSAAFCFAGEIEPLECDRFERVDRCGLLGSALFAGINAVIDQPVGFSHFVRVLVNEVSSYSPSDRLFSRPPKRYFHRDHFEPLGFTTMYSPPPSNSWYGLSRAFA